MDNILNYSRLKEEHETHLGTALQKLHEHCMYAKLSNYEFWFSEVVILKHVVSVAGIVMDQAMVDIILNGSDLPHPWRSRVSQDWPDIVRDSYMVSLPWQLLSHC